MFKMLDEVEVIQGKSAIKRGIIVGITNCGAKVYDSQQETPYTDSVVFAEWFPFQSSQSRMKMIKPHVRKK